ncbi:hypothetical protein ACWT_4556 [Actinoplanes sp. SE50]|uniref:hypothetical protein n=1 Tax=unclassified Actinoplanes TaxID=2626549 RepID=UPI00023ED27A|nr:MULTISPECIES: hypothetical protein [unclassified Actinoplanes]AEV85578.1 hypothetical protein ACPL_4687 [Actinoplanes sp. SE50/110]ATO83971.1 hypothetical protein ACWT_4556 [Actinoplanes sp. SE50]SLM01381.1 hypothetical protein ACSP50_4617 [Actinoplanes sp. SE50/110]
MRTLIVRGGWAGHEPAATTDSFLDLLHDHGCDVRVADTLDAYRDPVAYDLIVQCWTGARFTAEQEAAPHDHRPRDPVGGWQSRRP